MAAAFGRGKMYGLPAKQISRVAMVVLVEKNIVIA